jgi:anaphase-promoting complex subunit 4
VHNFSTCSEDNRENNDNASRVTCVNWGVNFTDFKTTRAYLEDSNGQLTAEDLLVPDTDPVRAAMLLKADLPRELALLDVESSLPKLSTLSGSGNE